MSDDDIDTSGRDGEPDTTLLASAYLDGEATTDERALVETSPTVLDEVRRFGDVRTVLGGTAPEASLSERESHLAGALDVWARMSDVERRGDATPIAGVDAAAAAALSTPGAENRKRGSRRRRERMSGSQLFLSAAAVLVVVAGGAAIARGVLDDTDDSGGEQFATESDEAAPSGVPDIDELEAAEVAGDNVGADAVLSADQIEGQVARDGSSDESGSTGLFDDDDLSADAADESEAMEEAAEAADEDDLATQPSPGSEDELVILVSPEQLAQFASLALPTFDEGPLSTEDVDEEPPSDSCEFDFGVEVIAGFAEYEGIAVTVGIDRDTDQALAYIDDGFGGCELIDSVPLSAGVIPTDS